MIGQATTGQLSAIFTLLIFMVIYLGLFAWYAKQMKKRNELYLAEKN